MRRDKEIDTRETRKDVLRKSKCKERPQCPALEKKDRPAVENEEASASALEKVDVIANTRRAVLVELGAGLGCLKLKVSQVGQPPSGSAWGVPRTPSQSSTLKEGCESQARNERVEVFREAIFPKWTCARNMGRGRDRQTDTERTQSSQRKITYGVEQVM